MACQKPLKNVWVYEKLTVIRTIFTKRRKIREKMHDENFSLRKIKKNLNKMFMKSPKCTQMIKTIAICYYQKYLHPAFIIIMKHVSIWSNKYL